VDPSKDKEECVSYKELCDMMKVMTEMFTKNQASNNTCVFQLNRRLTPLDFKGKLDIFKTLKINLQHRNI
jgi:hypothetical protein